VGAVDPRLIAALAAQLRVRRRVLRTGVAHVGWKLGIGDAERIAGEIAVGHLTSATLRATESTFHSVDAVAPHADAEIFLEIGRELPPNPTADEARRAISAYGGALELVDLAGAQDGPEAVIAGNIFHRAVAFGPCQPELPADGLDLRMLVNGEVRAAARATDDLAARLSAAARVLDAVHERIRTGDRVITGSVVQVAVSKRDHVVADFGPLGCVQLAIAPSCGPGSATRSPDRAQLSEELPNVGRE
jgi:2-keto-4-pentenoate hydratase